MQRGDRRGARAARTPHSSSLAHLCIHVSAQASIYVCVGRVAGCMRVCMRGRVREGVWREGKREVLREQGVGEADGVIVGYALCTRVDARASMRACVCVVCGCAHMCVSEFIRVFFYVYLLAHICTSHFVASHNACSVQTIIGYFSPRDGAGYSAAAYAAASHACVRRRSASPACYRRAAVARPARPAQATSTTSTCTIRPPGPGQTSQPPSAAPRHRPGAVTASRRRGTSSTCTGAIVTAVREGRGGRRAWGWWGPRRGGATCCHETGTAVGRRAWGRVASPWQARRRAGG
jgi:hypothetical protein